MYSNLDMSYILKEVHFDVLFIPELIESNKPWVVWETLHKSGKQSYQLMSSILQRIENVMSNFSAETTLSISSCRYAATEQWWCGDYSFTIIVAQNLPQNHVSVPPWFLNSDCVLMGTYFKSLPM